MQEREVAALVQVIRDRASSSGVAVDGSKALYGFANEVIYRTVFGRVSREEGRRSELFRELIEENTTLLGGFCVGDYFSALEWADAALSGAGVRAWRDFRRRDELLEKMLEEHERQRGDDSDAEQEDFVDVLLDMSDALAVTTPRRVPLRLVARPFGRLADYNL
ncbi:3-hydroxyindolin-2-one monooxygenase-like [Phragmites australis]|uniref:3-hydroxyindolin-2-one monooxygenase-like n=1 Tax=Phragmites australis TaxID=29695 RepID=UPI002D7900BC|nr:3-hydroxyindolin-2-one monooxygenase-like [Phragmites australis]